MKGEPNTRGSRRPQAYFADPKLMVGNKASVSTVSNAVLAQKRVSVVSKQ